MFKTIFLAASCAVAFPFTLNYIEEVRENRKADREFEKNIAYIRRHINGLAW